MCSLGDVFISLHYHWSPAGCVMTLLRSLIGAAQYHSHCVISSSQRCWAERIWRLGLVGAVNLYIKWSPFVRCKEIPVPRKKLWDSVTYLTSKKKRHIGRQRATVCPSVLPSSPKFHTLFFLLMQLFLSLKKDNSKSHPVPSCSTESRFLVIFCLLHHVWLWFLLLWQTSNKNQANVDGMSLPAGSAQLTSGY